jgi:hypothetical protein
MKTSLKDWPKVYRKFRGRRGLNEHEKVLFARCAAATPDERWQMNVERCKALGVWGKGLVGNADWNDWWLAGKYINATRKS